MKEYRIILQPQFLEELDSILYFFRNTYTDKRKLYTEIRNTVFSLSIFPERYTIIDNNLKAADIRKLPINKFIVIYQVDNEKGEVYILHIFSEKQNYSNQI